MHRIPRLKHRLKKTMLPARYSVEIFLCNQIGAHNLFTTNRNSCLFFFFSFQFFISPYYITSRNGCQLQFFGFVLKFASKIQKTDHREYASRQKGSRIRFPALFPYALSRYHTIKPGLQGNLRNKRTARSNFCLHKQPVYIRRQNRSPYPNGDAFVGSPRGNNGFPRNAP